MHCYIEENDLIFVVNRKWSYINIVSSIDFLLEIEKLEICTYGV